MKNERCSYCGASFANEAAYERHLLGPRQRCMTQAEMHDAGFTIEVRGWFLDAPIFKKASRKRTIPPTLDL